MKKIIFLCLLFVFSFFQAFSQEQSNELEEQVDELQKAKEEAREDMKEYRERVSKDTSNQQKTQKKIASEVSEEKRSVREMVNAGMRRKDAIASKYAKKFGVGINFGIIGIGLDAAYNFHPNFNAVIFYDYFRLKASTLGKYIEIESGLEDISFGDSKSTVSVSGDGFSISNTETVEYDFSGNTSNAGFKLNGLLQGTLYNTILGGKVEVLPFKRSSFKLVAGVGYFLNPLIKFTADLDIKISFSDPEIQKVLSESDLSRQGSFSVLVETKRKLSPYFGIGFGRAVPRGRVGFGMEVGSYFTGGYKLTTTLSEKLKNKGLEEYIEKIEDIVTKELSDLDINLDIGEGKDLDIETEIDKIKEDGALDGLDKVIAMPRIMFSLRIKI